MSNPRHPFGLFAVSILSLLGLLSRLGTSIAQRHCLINPYITSINDVHIKDLGNNKHQIRMEIVNDYKYLYSIDNIIFDGNIGSFDTLDAKFNLLETKICDRQSCQWSKYLKNGKEFITYDHADYLQERDTFLKDFEINANKFDQLYGPCQPIQTTRRIWLSEGDNYRIPEKSFSCGTMACCIRTTFVSRPATKVVNTTILPTIFSDFLSFFYKPPYQFIFTTEGMIIFIVYDMKYAPKIENLAFGSNANAIVSGITPFVPLLHKAKGFSFINEPECTTAIQSFASELMLKQNDILGGQIKLPILTLTQALPKRGSYLFAYYDRGVFSFNADQYEGISSQGGRLFHNLSARFGTNRLKPYAASQMYYDFDEPGSRWRKADMVVLNLENNNTYHWSIDKDGSEPPLFFTSLEQNIPDDIFHWRRCQKVVSIYGHTYTMHDFGQSLFSLPAKAHKINGLPGIPIEAAHAEDDIIFFVMGKYRVVVAKIDQRDCKRAAEEGLQLNIYSKLETLSSLSIINSSVIITEGMHISLDKPNLWIYILIISIILVALLLMAILFFMNRSKRQHSSKSAFIAKKGSRQVGRLNDVSTQNTEPMQHLQSSMPLMDGLDSNSKSKKKRTPTRTKSAGRTRSPTISPIPKPSKTRSPASPSSPTKTLKSSRKSSPAERKSIRSPLVL